MRGQRARSEEACRAWGQGVPGRLDEGSCGGEGDRGVLEDNSMWKVRGKGECGARYPQRDTESGGPVWVWFFQDGRTLAFFDC